MRFRVLWAFVITASVGSIGQSEMKVRAGEPSQSDFISAIRQTPNWRFLSEEFIESIRRRQPSLQGTPVTVLGVVSDASKSPIHGALVLLRVPSNRSDVRLHDGVAKDVFAVTFTDPRGLFKFRSQPTPWAEPLRASPWEVWAFAPGHAFMHKVFDRIDGRPHLERFYLPKAQTIRGSIVDADQLPVPGAQIALAAILHCEPAGRFGPISAMESNLLFSELQTYVTTESDGSFQIGGLPEKRIASLSVRTPGYTDTGLRHQYTVATSDNLDRSQLVDQDHRFAHLIYPLQDPECEIRSKHQIAQFKKSVPSQSPPPIPRRTATIHVVDDVTGQGVAGVGVSVLPATDRDDLSISKQPERVTDDRGTARLSLPTEACTVVAYGRRFGYLTHFERISTDPNEFTPDVAAPEWIRRIESGEQPVKVSFRVRPAEQLQVRVKTRQGRAVKAELSVQAIHWDYWLPPVATDDQGSVSIPIRPIFFDALITATTESGLSGSVNHLLSKQMNAKEMVTVIVEKE